MLLIITLSSACCLVYCFSTWEWFYLRTLCYAMQIGILLTTMLLKGTATSKGWARADETGGDIPFCTFGCICLSPWTQTTTLHCCYQKILRHHQCWGWWRKECYCSINIVSCCQMAKNSLTLLRVAISGSNLLLLNIWNQLHICQTSARVIMLIQVSFSLLWPCGNALTLQKPSGWTAVLRDIMKYLG